MPAIIFLTFVYNSNATSFLLTLFFLPSFRCMELWNLILSECCCKIAVVVHQPIFNIPFWFQATDWWNKIAVVTRYVVRLSPLHKKDDNVTQLIPEDLWNSSFYYSHLNLFHSIHPFSYFKLNEMGIRNKERIETNIVECFAKYSQVNIKVERNVSITCNKNVIHHQRKWRNTRDFKIKQNGFWTIPFC